METEPEGGEGNCEWIQLAPNYQTVWAALVSGQQPGLGAQGEGTRAVSSSRVTSSTLRHPMGADAPKKPGNYLWKALCCFFPSIMMKAVVFRGKILFQTLGIWVVAFLENGVIPAFL